MALTQKQKDAIKRAMKQNIAKRAALQRTKISDSEARKASSTMNKRPDKKPAYVQKDASRTLSRSEVLELDRTEKVNAAQEKRMQKQRKFAKGEGKLPLKERVGTKAEYKQLGKDIKTRQQLIAYGKAARAAQKERAANPKPTLTKATPAKAETPMAKKKTAPAKTTSKTTTPKPKGMTKADKAIPTKYLPRGKSKPTPKTTISKPMTKAEKATPAKYKPLVKGGKSTKTFGEVSRNVVAATDKPKASTAAIKKRTSPNTKSTPKTVASKFKTLEQARAEAPKPKTLEAKKMQTLAEARANAPKPKLGPEAPTSPKVAEAPKPASKISSKISDAKKAAKSSTAGKLVKATKAAAKPIVESASKGKTVTAAKKIKKVSANKYARGAVKSGAALSLLLGEGASVVSNKTSKEFKQIQRLENQLAKIKGQKPKYTNMGSNKNPISALKGNFAQIASDLTFNAVGKTRQARIAELQKMINKASKTKPAVNKPTVKSSTKSNATITTPGGQVIGGNKSGKTAMGDKYIVKKGDTLSGIASRSGVSLKEIREANPKFKAQAKYKNGSMIFSGTSVAIPKKKVK